MLLVAKAHPTIARLAARSPRIGRLCVPRDCSRVAETAALGVPWAADNDAFGGWGAEKEAAFLRMLHSIAYVPGCLFVAAPDVVADAEATLERWAEWWQPIRRVYRLPVALVTQDGLTLDDVPWDQLDAVFVGGTDAWKYGDTTRAIVVEAKVRGKHVHMGRVNTNARAQWAQAIGVDSVDGSKFSRWTDTYIEQGVAWTSAAQQLPL